MSPNITLHFHLETSNTSICLDQRRSRKSCRATLIDHTHIQQGKLADESGWYIKSYQSSKSYLLDREVMWLRGIHFLTLKVNLTCTLRNFWIWRGVLSRNCGLHVSLEWKHFCRKEIKANLLEYHLIFQLLHGQFFNQSIHCYSHLWP